ncbi:hypothetical protein HGA88_01970 [Candidatus Roizmanbacteria bacterium]|nr:hypothetical protein [Candidatus Roizmanbacteria bacterium]
MKQLREIALEEWLFVLCGILFFVFLSFNFHFLSDDAFITFRYVKHFLAGWGPVYNKGELIEGFSSPLWFLLLSGFGYFHFDLVFAGRALGLLFSLAEILLFYVFVSKQGFPFIAKLFGFLFLCLNAVRAVWSLGGLEEPLYSFLLFTFFFCWYENGTGIWTKKRYVGFAFLSFILVLARSEGVIFVAFYLGSQCFTVLKRKSFWPLFWYALPFFALFLLGIVVRWNIFHDWVPNTYYAKVGATFYLYLRGIDYVFQYFWSYGYGSLAVCCGIAAYVSRRRSYLALLMILGVVGGTIFVGGDGLPMYRFLLPMLPYLAWMLVITADYVWQTRTRTTFILSICIGLFIVGRSMIPAQDTQYQYYFYQSTYEIPRWTAVGKWLQFHAKPTDSLAAVPIGAVGYYSDLYVWDMMGLTNAHIAKKNMSLGNGWAGHEKHDGPYILKQKPTYLLLGNIQVLDEQLATDDARFIHPFNTEIRAREDDMFVPDLWDWYEKNTVALDEGLYLHYGRLK